jgi:hypothetical protein
MRVCNVQLQGENEVTILDAIKSACEAAGLELVPGANLGKVEDALIAANFALDVDQSTGRLCALLNGFPASLDVALKALARKPEFSDTFEVDISRVTKYSQLKTLRRKNAFIAQHGLAQFERLVGQKL